MYVRSFPTVEQSCQSWQGEAYVPLPENKDVASIMLKAVGQDTTQVIEDFYVSKEQYIILIYYLLGCSS